MKTVTAFTVQKIAQKLNLSECDYDCYGSFAVKLTESWLSRPSPRNPSNSSLVLVTGITPTPAGEGKTTTAIALSDALQSLRSTSLCLRQASLGPFFGVKGGASGGGQASLAFPEKTNLHFTGDFHAIATAHNLVAAYTDNHIFQNNPLNIDPQKIIWKRTIDMNDRSLRDIRISLGTGNGTPRGDQFIIVAASEIMASLCLAHNSEDLQQRLERIVIGLSNKNEPIFLKDIQAQKALSLLLEDAIRPNLTATRYGSPCFVHGGPFANIAHGCNSLRATEAALGLSDIVVTEAGFGSDLGAEKFLSIKSPLLKVRPKLAVLVASLRALKFHGGQDRKNLSVENLEALGIGLSNLNRHIELIQNLYGLNCVVALNIFSSDTENEIRWVEKHLQDLKIASSRCEGFLKGATGARDLAEKVLSLIDSPRDNSPIPIYRDEDSFMSKLTKLAIKVHGATDISLSSDAQADLQLWGPRLDKLPICLAKTPFSFSADPKAGGLLRPHTLPIQRVLPAFGAGFVVVTTGEIMLMPGLPKTPYGISEISTHL